MSHETLEKETDSIPLGDRVLVKIEKKEKVVAGLVIADVESASMQRLSQEGVVVAIGDGWDKGRYKVVPQIKKGDKIVFGKFAGTEVKLDGQDHIIMGFSDVLGVVNASHA